MTTNEGQEHMGCRVQTRGTCPFLQQTCTSYAWCNHGWPEWHAPAQMGLTCCTSVLSSQGIWTMATLRRVQIGIVICSKHCAQWLLDRHKLLIRRQRPLQQTPLPHASRRPQQESVGPTQMTQSHSVQQIAFRIRLTPGPEQGLRHAAARVSY